MSIEKTITTVLFDLTPMLYHLVRYGLTERAEHARDAVTRPWMAACQPAPVAQPDTDDAASARVELVGVELELIHARAQLKRWDRRWELSERVVKRLQTELDAARADVVRLTTERDALDDDLIQRTRERDAARKAINGLAAQLVQRVTRLGKVVEENERLRRELAETNGQLGARGGDILTLNEENAQLREDLAAARKQKQGTPADGETVTLRLGTGKTSPGQLVTGPLPHNMGSGIDRIVDHINRALGDAAFGGEGRG